MDRARRRAAALPDERVVRARGGSPPTGGKRTRERILEASRQLFNKKGYTRTTLAEIAAAVGIAEGNLWYHFRTKLDLVAALEDEVRRTSRAHIAANPSGDSIAADYVRCVLFSMKVQWENRFLLRDYLQFSNDPNATRLDPDMAAQFETLTELLARMKREGMFRRDLAGDVKLLARSLWIVSRYWTDHLREQEGLDEITWADQERGFRQHLAVLLPYLTAPARRALEAAAADAAREITPGNRSRSLT